MALAQGGIAVGSGPLNGSVGLLLVGYALSHGMLVEAIVAGGIHHIEDGLCGTAQPQRRVGGLQVAALMVDLEISTEVYALLRITHGMAVHGDARSGSLTLVGNQRGEREGKVQAAGLRRGEADGNESVGMGNEVFTAIGHSGSLITVAAEGTVDVELTLIAFHLTQGKVLDVKRAEGHVISRVRSLHEALQ